MHVDGERDVRSFDEWLGDQEDTFDNYDANFSGMAKNGKELRDWWISPDAFNYNFAGTNRGTSQVLTGRESTDDVYGDYEYPDVYGLSEFAQRTFDSSAARDAIELQKGYAAKAKELADKAENESNRRKKEQYSGSATAYQGNTDRAGEDAKKAWTNYMSSIDSGKAELYGFFKKKVGTSVANEFWSEYDWLEKEYNSIVQEAKRHGTYDEELVRRFDRWYSDLLKQMNVYIKKHGYDKKTSGF